MTGEINRDWYCVRYGITDGGFNNKPEPCVTCKEVCNKNLEGKPYKEAKRIYDGYEYCVHRHRKWPTPEQFKDEYGKEYPAGGLYFVRSDYPLEEHCDGSWGEWKTDIWSTGMTYDHSRVQVVCACTPWGKPPADWRP